MLPASLAAACDAHRVVVLMRVGCHLCEEAEATAAAVCAPGTWTTLDVDADAELTSRYTDHVPVTFVDGEQFALWTLDETRLRAVLADEA